MPAKGAPEGHNFSHLDFDKHVVCVGRFPLARGRQSPEAYARVDEVSAWLQTEESGSSGLFGFWVRHAHAEEGRGQRLVFFVLDDPDTAFNTKIRWG